MGGSGKSRLRGKMVEQMREQQQKETAGEAYKNYFLEQLGGDTMQKLLNLKLANNSEAEKHLVAFLKAMGVPDKQLMESGVVHKMAEKKDAHDSMAKNMEQIHNII